MDNRKKVLNLLGLATKAGKIASGEFATERSAKDGKSFLVLVSEEASENTKKKFRNTCDYYQIPFCLFGKADELGPAMGKQVRMSLSINDEGFAKAILKLVDSVSDSKSEE